MTYSEAISYIHSLGVFGSRPGLSRVRELCKALDNPQEKIRFIHIAGTNGKGSVCSMLSEILISSGLKVGLYTSPFISFFEERIKINGEPISKERLAEVVERVKLCADKLSEPVTEFEIITAAAFLFFYQESCDVVVLETGLGGRLDATNIISSPLISVITGIGLDHTAVLGDTVEKIAAEKAGIIKKNCPVVLARCESGAASVIKGVAESLNADVFDVDYLRAQNKAFKVGETSFDIEPYGRITLRLSGVYQADNALTCITAAEVLKSTLNISDAAIKRGLLNARWPARFEVIRENPLIIYDGAHNPQGVAALAQNIKQILGGSVILLAGVMADKDYNSMAKTLFPFIKEAFTVTPDNSRALSAEELCRVFKDFDIPATACKTAYEGVKAAVSAAKEHKLPIVTCGTLYMYKQIKDVIS